MFSFFSRKPLASGDELDAAPNTPAFPGLSVVDAAQVVNDTLVRTSDSARLAKRKYDEHKDEQEFRKKKLGDTERRQTEAEIELRLERDAQINISAAKIKNREERKEINEADDTNRVNLKIKQEAFDKCKSEYKEAYNEHREGEIEKKTLKINMDKEQKVHDEFIKAIETAKKHATDVNVFAGVSKCLDFKNGESDDEVGDCNLAIVPVEDVEDGDEDDEDGDYSITVLKTSKGVATEVRVISQTGEEETYEIGDFVRVNWGDGSDVDEDMFDDGVSYTEFLNNACIGEIIAMATFDDGKLKFGLRLYYSSSFTIDTESRVRSSQKFLHISDRVWTSKDVGENEFFKAEGDPEFYEVDCIDGKFEFDDSATLTWDYKLWVGKTKGGKLYIPK